MPEYNNKYSHHQPAGRRHRLGEPSPSKSSPSSLSTGNNSTRPSATKSKSVADAKAKFVSNVSRGITVLMEECGYSRERATTALLREIARGDSNPPDENEVFDVMFKHGLSMEAAVSALTVSKALQREVAERDVCMVQAIDDLTSKLSVANLTRRGALSNLRETTGDADGVSIPPPRVATEMRIAPVVPSSAVDRTPRQPQKPTTTATTKNNSSIPPVVVETCSATSMSSKKKSGNNKQKNANATRKRTVDENMKLSSENNNKRPEEGSDYSKTTTRGRSDSLSEVVNAKFAENSAKKSASDDEASTATVRSGKAAVRAKRSRSLDAGTGEAPSSTTSVKRSRTSSATAEL